MVFQWFTDEVGDAISAYPGRISLAFLLLTGVFLLGLGNVETESGSNQFVEDLDSFEAFEDIQREFGSSFGESSTTTQLLQREQNVLSRPSLLRMLRTQERLQDHEGLRVTSVSSPARIVAQQLDPEATTVEDQIDAVESATASEIDRAVRSAADTQGFTSQVSEDFDRQSAAARAAQATVTHGRDVDSREERVERVIATVGGNVETVGSAPDTIGSSLALVLPAAFILIILFLIVAYRDLVDLLLGGFAIVMTLLWTFGFLGLADIPFNPLLVAVPPLLIAVGIDFGIHAVNRYREERERGEPIGASMTLTTEQLLVAFFIVMGTTVIGFLSNLTSALEPIRDFGVVAAIGICFTFLIFGIFLPAAKVKIDRMRDRYPIPTLSERPLGSEGSALGRLLNGGVVIARRAPVLFMLVALVGSGAAGVYATGVGTGFSEDDFLPPEYDELPDWQKDLPGPFSPPEYSYIEKTNYIDENFEASSSVMLFVETRMGRDAALDQVHRIGRDPPPTFLRDGRHAESQSIVTVVQSYQERDPEFRDLVARNDPDADGIPEQNLGEVYDYLESAARKRGRGRPRRGPSEYARDLLGGRRRLEHGGRRRRQGGRRRDAHGRDADRQRRRLRGGVEPDPRHRDHEPDHHARRRVGVPHPRLRHAGGAPVARRRERRPHRADGDVRRRVDALPRHRLQRDQRGDPLALDRAVRGTGGALTGSMLTTVAGTGMLVFALNPAIGASAS